MMPQPFFQSKETEARFFFILAGALIFFMISSFVLDTRVERDGNSSPTRLVEKSFPAVSLEAKGALVLDLRTGEVLFEKNADAPLPLASVTKLMSAVVALELSPEYGTVKVTSGALKNYGDSGLKNDEKWSLKNMLDFSLLTSSNDGIRAVALSLAASEKSAPSDEELIASFVSAMNKKAESLGLLHTSFSNESGLDVERADGTVVKNGAYGSARDMAILMGYLLKTHPEALEATRESETTVSSMDNLAHAARNTNVLIGAIPGVLGSKTGFTDLAGGNVVFAFDPELGHPIVISVLGSSADGRFADAERLIEATMTYIRDEN